MKKHRAAVCPTPLGDVTLICSEEGITALRFGACIPENAEEGDAPILVRCYLQLCEYLKGERWEFDLPLAPEGTEFQRKVWQALRTIPYGQTRSYAEIAAQVGSPRACRAVGMANHKNPISILIPCHRVVGKNGALTGYAGGLERKKSLLELERKYVKK